MLVLDMLDHIIVVQDKNDNQKDYCHKQIFMVTYPNENKGNPIVNLLYHILTEHFVQS